MYKFQFSSPITKRHVFTQTKAEKMSGNPVDNQTSDRVGHINKCLWPKSAQGHKYAQLGKYQQPTTGLFAADLTFELATEP